MVINISEILKQNGASLCFNIEKNILNTNSFRGINKFLSPVKVEGTVTNLDGVFNVLADGSAEVESACDRCLKPVSFKLDFKINENFSNTGKEKEAETFSGDIIDLEDVVSRGILTSLPMKGVCSEDCKGLCPICGKDLNDGVCECRTDYIDPRFESLRSLFKLDEEV